MNYTDENIPIKCAECDFEVEGVERIEEHILLEHPDYTTKQAIAKAREWADAAYDEMETWEYNQLTPSQQRGYRADQHGH